MNRYQLSSFVKLVVLACCLTSQQLLIGTIHEVDARFKIREPFEKPWRNEVPPTIQLKGADKLPEDFSRSRLPKPVQDSRDGEAVNYDYLDLVELLTNVIPDNPFEIDTQFHIFSGGKRRVVPFKQFNTCLKKDSNQCKKIPMDLNKVSEVFDPRKRTVIIIGGFLTIAPSDWQLQVADRWLRLEDVNVIIVGWNKGNRWWYDKAVRNTKLVARQTVVLLYHIARLHNIDPRDRAFAERIIIVGHSLGAHIAGFIGQDFGGHLGRITGLDPAGPMFTENQNAHRLDRSDAIVVDVIHTNADFGYRFFLGIYNQVGHIDYYANDGKWQPNCHVINFLQCNHSAVINYYISVLDHELLMKAYFDRKSRDNYRMVAYLAKSYDEFRSGQALDQHCPNMANDGYDTLMQSGLDFNKCGLPIDFVKPAREWRQELQDKFNIDFSPDYKPSQKFYFFTSAKKPFVVDHNLLKLHYDMPEKYDAKKKSCSLEVSYKMLDGEKLVGELPHFKPNPNYPDHNSTVIPFVVPTQVGRYKLINVDSANFFSDHQDVDLADEEIIREAYMIFPAQLSIETYDVDRKPEGKMAKVSRWMLATRGDSLDKPIREAQEPKMCSHKFKTVRIQPLRRTNRLFMAVYSSLATLPSGEIGSSGSFKPTVIRLKEGEPVPYIDVPGSIVDPTLYLDTIIIGPNHFDILSRGEPEGMRTPYSDYLATGMGRPVFEAEANQDMARITETYWQEKNRLGDAHDLPFDFKGQI